MYIGVCMCAGVYPYVCTLVFVWVHVLGNMLQRFGLVWWDPDPLRETRICVHRGLNSQENRRPIHEMIWRLVPVRAMKTRWQFGSKIVSFHMSVCSCVFPYLPLSACIYMVLSSFHVTFCYIWLVWLLVSLHETSMIVHFICVVDMSLYQCHFMCW